VIHAKTGSMSPLPAGVTHEIDSLVMEILANLELVKTELFYLATLPGAPLVISNLTELIGDALAAAECIRRAAASRKIVLANEPTGSMLVS